MKVTSSEESDSTLVELRHPVAPLVLIVDEDPVICERLRGLVMAAGFEASCVCSGAAALSALRATFTPIVITGRSTVGMDGLALCRAIRAERFTGYIYVLLLIAQDTDADILAGLDAGVDDYLNKRASPAQLVARLRIAQRILTLEHSLRSVVTEKSRLATTDTLTGASNRRYLLRHLARELKRVRRFGGEVAVLMLDIDEFKQVNDRYGHAVGDDVLKEFASRIARGLPREYDWFARTGGEEFIVVLPQTALAGARVVAEKLRVLVAAQPLRTAAGPVAITVSIGVGAIAGGGALVEELTVDQLLDMADRCLYESKAAGRNRVSWPGQSTSSRIEPAVVS